MPSTRCDGAAVADSLTLSCVTSFFAAVLNDTAVQAAVVDAAGGTATPQTAPPQPDDDGIIDVSDHWFVDVVEDPERYVPHSSHVRGPYQSWTCDDGAWVCACHRVCLSESDS